MVARTRALKHKQCRAAIIDPSSSHRFVFRGRVDMGSTAKSKEQNAGQSNRVVEDIRSSGGSRICLFSSAQGRKSVNSMFFHFAHELLLRSASAELHAEKLALVRLELGAHSWEARTTYIGPPRVRSWGPSAFPINIPRHSTGHPLQNAFSLTLPR